MSFGIEARQRRLIEQFVGAAWRNLLSSGDEPVDVEYEVDER
jgi:hypothetical protein